MAFMECNFFSESLGMCVSANVILPQTTTSQIGLKGTGSPDGCPVLYLLHGMSDDHSIWCRRTSIERYATEYGIAVVMPNAHRSFYNDMRCGLKYWTYVSEELPQIMSSFFKFSTKREDTFAAGLSMGGFGAFKLAFHKADRFAAIACFSSVIRPIHLLSLMEDRRPEYENVFGDLDKLPGSANDLYFQAEQAKKNGVDLPKLFVVCGTEDFLYQENIDYKKHLETLGIPFEFRQGPGTHCWGFWDHYIQEFLAWAPIKKA